MRHMCAWVIILINEFIIGSFEFCTRFSRIITKHKKREHKHTQKAIRRIYGGIVYDDVSISMNIEHVIILIVYTIQTFNVYNIYDIITKHN